MEDKEAENTILERMKNAGETLGISQLEIINEITKLSIKEDVKGMRLLFEAFKKWEVSGKRENASNEEAEELAARNFDYCAQMADNLQVSGGDKLSAAIMTVEKDDSWGGKITKFYRKAVGYEPPPGSTSSQN